MSKFLRRSLLQAFAAVVLMTGANVSDLFAATTHPVAATTGGATASTVKGSLWKWETVGGMPQWVQVEVNGSFARFDIPLVSSTPSGPPGYSSFIYGVTLTGLTPGTQYAVVKEIRTGTAAPYTYTYLDENHWTQP